MGYRSQVRIAISKKGYKEMCNYLVDYAKRIGFNKEAILEILKDTDINLENKYQKYFGWDWIKWYDGYPQIDAITEALSYVEEKGYSYKFSRIGEDFTDIEEYGCDGEKYTRKNLFVDFPYLDRGFDDVAKQTQLIEQEKILNKNKKEQER